MQGQIYNRIPADSEFVDLEVNDLGNKVFKMFMTYDCGEGPQNQWVGHDNER